MTSKISSNKTLKTGNFYGNARQYNWLALMSFVLFFFCTTLPVTMQVLDRIQEGEQRSQYLASAQYHFLDNYVLYNIGAVIALVSAVTLFKYLNSKPEVDFFHSLPLKSEHIFFSRYVLGLAFFALPFLFHWLVTYLICLVGPFQDLPSFGAVLAEYFRIFAFYASVYAFITLGVIVTGNNFMAIATGIGFSQAPTALIMVDYWLREGFLQFYSGSEELTLAVVRYTNPFGMLFFGTSTRGNGWELMLQMVVLLVISFFCFQKRPSENASNPVALPLFKLVIKGLGVVCGASIGGIIFLFTIKENLGNFLLGAFLVGGTLHMAFEMLFEMDIRAGLRKKKHFVLLYALVALFGTVICLDLTNYDEKIYPPEEISSITWQGVTLESPENVLIVHQMMEDNIQGNLDDFAYWSNSLNVKVKLKNGASYQRNYNYGTLSLEKYLDLTLSQEWILQNHNYNLTPEYFQELRERQQGDEFGSSINDFEVSYGNSRQQYSVDQFEEIYALILSENHLLTPEYLRENSPVLIFTNYTMDYYHRQIPVYSVHQAALEKIQPHTLPLPSLYNLELQGKGETVAFSKLDQSLQEAIIEEMIPIHDEYSSRDHEYRRWSSKENWKVVANNSLYGYLSYEALEALEDRLNQG